MSKNLVEDSRILANIHTGGKKSVVPGKNILVKARCALIVAKEVTLSKFVTRNMAIRQASKPDKGAEAPIFNQVSTENPEDIVEQDQDQESQKSLNDVFTPEQYQALLALLQQNHVSTVNHITTAQPSNTGSSYHFISNVLSKPHFWILDSGATDHVCCSLNHFSVFKSINSINVKLPNGSSVLASYSGTMHFSDDLILTDVLYIPEFTFNLISITKLTNSLSCQLIFSPNHCLIQERHSLKTIGSAEV